MGLIMGFTCRAPPSKTQPRLPSECVMTNIDILPTVGRDICVSFVTVYTYPVILRSHSGKATQCSCV